MSDGWKGLWEIAVGCLQVIIAFAVILATLVVLYTIIAFVVEEVI